MKRYQTYGELRASRQPRRTRIFQGIVQGLFIGFLIVNVLPKRSETNDLDPRPALARFSRSQIGLNSLSPLDHIHPKTRNAMGDHKTTLTADRTEDPTPESETVSLKSLLCSSSEAARAEVLEKVRKLVGERLAKYNLDDSRSVTTAIKSMNLNLSVDESFKEVAGEKYPLYTARVDVVFGKDFDANIMKLVIHRTAQNRVEWLMSISVLIVVCLIVFDQTLWGRRSETKKTSADVLGA